MTFFYVKMEEVGRGQGGDAAMPPANLFSIPVDFVIARALPETISN
jgi:hypothetical protein